MSERLPLFPLGAVLFPGMVLPLHIFEDRYRRLVQDLTAGPEPRRFGVVAIRKGRETGISGVSALYDVGCLAAVRQVHPHEDGRFDLVTVGAQRFRLGQLDESLPYLQADVEPLQEPVGDPGAAAHAAATVAAAFRRYLAALYDRGMVGRAPTDSETAASGDDSASGDDGVVADVAAVDLPGEPVVLSYLVAASMIIDLADRQALLAEPDAASRLTAERALLVRETAMVGVLPSTPAPELRYAPYSPN